jgi:hypothetical protein
MIISKKSGWGWLLVTAPLEARGLLAWHASLL